MNPQAPSGRFSILPAFAVAFAAIALMSCQSTPRSNPLREFRSLDTLFRQPTPSLRKVLGDPETFRAQILVSEVVSNASGRSLLRRYGYRVDAEYFYPASSIKLCAAIAALQTLESLETSHRASGLAEAPFVIEPLFPGDTRQSVDSADSPDSAPVPIPITLRRELRKLALVSDNQAFNRLYDLVGHEALNGGMHALGLDSVVINHRLSDPRTIPNPLATAAVRFHPPGAPEISLPPRISSLSLTNTGPRLTVGTAHVRGDTTVPAPMDFTRRNGISLVDLQDLLVKLARPDVDLGTPPLRLAPNHRALLLDAMTEYPRESTDPRYPVLDYPDHYSKFLLPGVRRVFPNVAPGERIEITGKIGRAYGFSVENAYLSNPRNGRAVFVTAVLYTNSDGILNDDKYEYEDVADPFLSDLGEQIARRWLAPSEGEK